MESSDDDVEIESPNWFKRDNGEGKVIKSSQCGLDLKIRCIADGKLNIQLRALDVRYKDNSRVPIFIEYTNFKINGNQIINGSCLVSYEKLYQCEELTVRNEDIIFIHLEWIPFLKYNG